MSRRSWIVFCLCSPSQNNPSELLFLCFPVCTVLLSVVFYSAVMLLVLSVILPSMAQRFLSLAMFPANCGQRNSRTAVPVEKVGGGESEVNSATNITVFSPIRNNHCRWPMCYRSYRLFLENDLFLALQCTADHAIQSIFSLNLLIFVIF